MYDDAEFAGCTETQRATSGLHVVCQGPHTNFPFTGMSKRQGCVSRSTPAAELVEGSQEELTVESCLATETRQVLKERKELSRGSFFAMKKQSLEWLET